MSMSDFTDFASHRHPFDLLEMDRLEDLAKRSVEIAVREGEAILSVGQKVEGLYLIQSGEVDLITPEGTLLLHLTVGNCFGERAMLSDGNAPNKAVASQDSTLFIIPKADFLELTQNIPSFHAYFDSSIVKRSHSSGQSDSTSDLISITIGELMTPNPITIAPETTAIEAAKLMQKNNISCLLITEQERLIGILTSGDMAHRIVAAGRSLEAPVRSIMTENPF